MMMVFFFHCARFFGGGGWHLKNPEEESFIATLFIGALDLWLMPLFFLLSGAGSWFALKTRTGGQYLVERAKRILIPLYGVGACILLLPQAYFEAVTNGGYTGTLREGIPLYFANAFTSVPDFDSPFFFNIFYGHLWFLMYVLFNTTMSMASWSWVAFMLNLGAKYLNVKSNFLTYGNEAVLPFYILHQTVILCVGWFVIRWNIGILSKYLIIAIVSFVLIMLIYEVIIRRFNVVRFLFCMRPKSPNRPKFRQH